jgi:hypothetical protein
MCPERTLYDQKIEALGITGPAPLLAICDEVIT